MAGQYQRSFVVAVPVARAWQAFVDPEEREKYVAAPGQRGDSWEAGALKSIVEGRPSTAIEIGQVEPLRLLSYREGVRFRVDDGDDGITDWLDVTVTFEDEGSGTRITFTRSGFGDSDDWRLFQQTQSLGQDEALADLVFYLETGVSVHAFRHYRTGMGSVGASMLESARGVEIVNVISGGFAEQAGLRVGDTLVALAGASVFKRSDVHAVERAFGPGARVTVEYVRTGALASGEAALSETNFTTRHGARGS